MKVVLSKLFAALFVSVIVLWTLFGVQALWAQDATEAAPEAVTTVEVPADAPVIVDVGDNVVSVETPPESITLIRNENPILVTIIMVLGAILAVFGGVIIIQGRMLFKALPPELQALLIHNRPVIQGYVTSGFTKLESATKLTPNQLDDMVAKYGRDAVNDILGKIYGDGEAVG